MALAILRLQVVADEAVGQCKDIRKISNTRVVRNGT